MWDLLQATELLPAMGDVALRGVLVLGAAGLVSVALRRASAAARHLVWAVAVSGVLVLPALRAVTPALDVGLPDLAVLVPAGGGAGGTAWTAPPATGSGTAVVPAAVEASGDRGADRTLAAGTDRVARADRLEVAEVGPAEMSSAAGGGRHGSAYLAPWLIAVWLVGALALMAPVVAGWLGTLWLAWRARPMPANRVRRAATRLALRMGMDRRFRVLEGGPGAMPMTFGFARPVILLPPEASEWSDRRLEAVLLHELAHVGRWDTATQLMGELVRALHWFNPLAWVAVNRLRVEREHACDDVALAGGTRPSDYADELLGLARRYRTSRVAGRAALAMARPSRLPDRLLAVLDAHRSHRRLGRAATVQAAAIGLTVLLPLAAVSPQPARATPAGQEERSPPAPATGDEVVTETHPALDVAMATGVTTEPAAAPLQEATCVAAPGEWDSTQHRTTNGRTTIRMERPGCELEVNLEGDIRLDRDATEIERLGRSAEVRIEEDNGRVTRYLEIVPGSNGVPEYAYREDRRSRPFDGPAQQWYRAVLTELFRSTGLFAEARVEALLDRGGVASVLRELANLRTDYAYASYAQALLEQAELDEAEVRTLVRSSTRRLDSDYYLSEVLAAAAAHQSLGAGLLDDFIEASFELDSDYYRTETLMGVLHSGRLDDDQVSRVLRAAGEMDSDHYRAEVLGSVADRYALRPQFRAVFLEETASMGSDHYRAQILSRLLERDDLTAPEKADVLRASGEIDSDHYRSELLAQVARLGLGNPDLHGAFFDVAADLDSDHYYTRAMGALLADGVGPTMLVTIIESATRELDSDHYRSELLMGILERYSVEGAVRDAVLDAIDAMDSSHYRGVVADALLRAERR